MKTITRDAATDHMNELQFADECWLQNMGYQDYVTSAELCGKRALTQEQYAAQCASNEEQTLAYHNS